MIRLLSGRWPRRAILVAVLVAAWWETLFFSVTLVIPWLLGIILCTRISSPIRWVVRYPHLLGFLLVVSATMLLTRGPMLFLGFMPFVILHLAAEIAHSNDRLLSALGPSGARFLAISNTLLPQIYPIPNPYRWQSEADALLKDLSVYSLVFAAMMFFNT